MVIYGGIKYDSSRKFTITNAFDEYSFSTLDWFRNDKLMISGSSPPERFFHSSITINDKMFVYGGIGKKKSNYDVLNDLWMLDSSKKWTQITSSSIPKSFGGKLFNNGNYLYMFGGNDGSKILNTVNIYDIDSSVVHSTIPFSNVFYFDNPDDEVVSSFFGNVLIDRGQLYMFG